MIPEGQYSQRAAQRLRDYLMDELRTAERDRKEKEDIWLACHEAYYSRTYTNTIPATVPNGPEFPFHGHSNLVIPVIATDVDTVFARMMGLLFEPDSLFSMSASNPDLSVVAPKIEEFMKWSQHNEVDWQSPVGDWILEILKLGTGILKQRYNREVKQVYEWRELQSGTWQQQAIILLKDAPSVHRVPLFDFFVPAGFRHFNELPWCSERIFLTWRRFLNRVSQGIYKPSSKITEAWASSSGSAVESRLAELSGFKQSRGNKLPLHEFWVNWDITENGMEQALVCTLHTDSGEYVRLDYNPFFNQEFPYSIARFMRDENSFYGIGLGEMGLDHQEEITAMHNQRIDNGTIMNSSMFAVSKGETDISEDEAVFPGKIWRLNNVEAIKPLQFGNANPVAGSIQTEDATMKIHQMRTGVGDWMFGQESQTSAYGAAYTYQQIGQNTTRRQGEFLRELRNALSESGTRVLEMYQQYNQRGKEYFALGMQGGQIVRQVLEFPLDLIRRALKVNVTAIDVTQNKDAKMRQNMLAMQQLMQYYAGVQQALQIAANPSLPPELKQTALDMIRGTSLLMSDILDEMGVQEADKMLPQIAGVVNDQQQRLAALYALIKGGASLGTGPMAGGPGQAAGMGSIPGLGFGAPGALQQPAAPLQQLGAGAPASPGSFGSAR